MKGFTINIGVRVVLLFLTLVLLTWMLFHTNMWITMGAIAIIVVVQMYAMVQYVNQVNRDLTKLTSSLIYEDYSVYFNSKIESASFKDLYDSYNEVIQKFQNKSLTQRARAEYFNIILSKVNIGIICLKTDSLQAEEIIIDFVNPAAMNILQIPPFKYWHYLKQSHPNFINLIEKLPIGEKKMIDVTIDSRQIPLIIEWSSVEIEGVPYLILNFQNVKTEMEQKEIESWNKVFKILAHEIMNSLTPINSLSNTIKMMLESDDGIPLAKGQIPEDRIENIHLAIRTIANRSRGMLDFVDSYRMFTDMPNPKLQQYAIAQLLEEVSMLMQPRLKKNQVHLEIQNAYPHIHLMLDPNLMEQVLINLILNSVYALEEVEIPFIRIVTAMEEQSFTISLTDNGKGINPVDLDQIWLPFFTTRKNGSGIGLSIVRNIIQAHQGQIWVESKEGEYTTFFIRLKIE